MAEKEMKSSEYVGEKTLTEDGKKIVEEEEVDAVNPSFATIMAKHKPNPWGKGHLQLYALATVCFLNSTMSGMPFLLFNITSLISIKASTARSWALSTCSPTTLSITISQIRALLQQESYSPSSKLVKCVQRSLCGLPTGWVADGSSSSAPLASF